MKEIIVPLHRIYKTRRNETDSNDFDGNAADVLLFGQRNQGRDESGSDQYGQDVGCQHFLLWH